VQPDNIVPLQAVFEIGDSTHQAFDPSEAAIVDQRIRYQQILEDARQNCELSRRLCEIARAQREFCAEQRAMPAPARVRAIRERRRELYTTDTPHSATHPEW
jgi:predicted aminopeptidase